MKTTHTFVLNGRRRSFRVDITQVVSTKVRTGLESCAGTLHIHGCSPVLLRLGFASDHLFCHIVSFQLLIMKYHHNFISSRLRPSRGCGPFRLYSSEPDYFFYYSVRNLISQISAKVLADILLKLTSAVVIVPSVLMLM